MQLIFHDCVPALKRYQFEFFEINQRDTFPDQIWMIFHWEYLSVSRRVNKSQWKMDETIQ